MSRNPGLGPVFDYAWWGMLEVLLTTTWGPVTYLST